MRGVTVHSFAEYTSAINMAHRNGETLVHVDNQSDVDFPKYLSFETQSVVDQPTVDLEESRKTLMARRLDSFTTVGELVEAMREAGL